MGSLDVKADEKNSLKDQLKDVDFSAINFTQYPDNKGHFGVHGGRFVSETLMAALEDLENLYNRMKNDAEFIRAFDYDLAHFVDVHHRFITRSG